MERLDYPREQRRIRQQGKAGEPARGRAGHDARTACDGADAADARRAPGNDRAQNGGTIINVASVASFIYSAGNVNYCATKAYLRVFTEGLATELIGTGVHVQALCPGFTRTEFHDRAAIDMKSTPAILLARRGRVVDDSLAQAARRGATVCIPSIRYKTDRAADPLSPQMDRTGDQDSTDEIASVRRRTTDAAPASWRSESGRRGSSERSLHSRRRAAE